MCARGLSQSWGAGAQALWFLWLWVAVVSSSHLELYGWTFLGGAGVLGGSLEGPC